MTMNRNNLQSMQDRANDTVRAFRTRAAQIGTGLCAALATGIASAQAADPVAAMTSEITSAKAGVGSIIVGLAAVVGLLLLWSYLKRAK
jgi:hypothetical protein